MSILWLRQYFNVVLNIALSTLQTPSGTLTLFNFFSKWYGSKVGEKSSEVLRDMSSYVFLHPQIAASNLHNAPGRIPSWLRAASIKPSRAGWARVLMRSRTQWMAPRKCSALPHGLGLLIQSYQEHPHTVHIVLWSHSIKGTLMWIVWDRWLMMEEI